MCKFLTAHFPAGVSPKPIASLSSTEKQLKIFIGRIAESFIRGNDTSLASERSVRIGFYTTVKRYLEQGIKPSQAWIGHFIELCERIAKRKKISCNVCLRTIHDFVKGEAYDHGVLQSFLDEAAEILPAPSAS